MAKIKAKTGDQITIVAEVRTVLGKKSKQLRKKGLLIGNIFGPHSDSIAITLKSTDFSVAYRKAKATGIMMITVGKDTIPTLVHGVQHHPVTNDIIHIDFRKVDLTKKIETFVPVTVTGVSEAVTQKAGILLTQTKQLMVEALPQDIPSEISVDISVLKEIGQEFKVSDLPTSKVYTVKELPEKVLLSVTAHKEESITPETTAVAPEVITAVPVEGAEGAEGAAAPAAGTPDKAAPAEKVAEKKAEKK